MLIKRSASASLGPKLACVRKRAASARVLGFSTATGGVTGGVVTGGVVTGGVVTGVLAPPPPPQAAISSELSNAPSSELSFDSSGSGGARQRKCEASLMVCSAR